MTDDTFKWVVAGGVILAARGFVAQAIATMMLMRKKVEVASRESE